MSKKLKKILLRIIIAFIIFVVAILVPFSLKIKLLFFVIGYILIGYDILLKSFRNIINGQVFDENFLMTIATFGAFALGDYAEAMAIMLFYQVGEFFQSYAVDRSRKSIANLMDIRPDYANIENNGKIEKVNPESVKIGDIIVVRVGEKIPLDGEIVDGLSSIDTSALTGESMPKDVERGDKVISGCINLIGLIRVKVEKEFSNSTVAKILDLVENATDKKSPLENFITRFSYYYTPIVIIIALILAIFPPLLFSSSSFSDWFYRSIIFLVVSCPCALVISVPLSFFAGLGICSRNGILVKGSNYLESLSKVKYMVFDKTGTLTRGNFVVSNIESIGISQSQLLELVAYAESYSSHPIAKSILEKYGKEIDISRIKNVSELHGMGVNADIDNKNIKAGNKKMLQSLNMDINIDGGEGTILYVIIDGRYSGYLLISDEVKDDSNNAINTLKNMGIKETFMLTGDRNSVGLKVANELKIDRAYTELLPADKVERLEEIMSKKSSGEIVAFVGDGINDAPVIARSDVGIAMGGMGSDATLEAADVIIMGDSLMKIPDAIKISRDTVNIARQNVIFAIGVKLAVLIFGALGLTSIWVAVFADVGVTLIAIINSIRMLFFAVYRKN